MSCFNYAHEGHFDLIVLGHQGHSRLWGVSLGHTTDKVSENAHCAIVGIFSLFS